MNCRLANAVRSRELFTGKKMASVPRVKGTRDFYPDDWALQIALRETMLAAGHSYGYQEYEGPAIEYLDLYLGKSSEEIVTQQTFRIQDRDGKALLLRPELTPTLARMVASREQEIILPARWQSWGQFFRYERPQRGRGRSFFQWNVDLLGSETPLADAEVIQVACALFMKLGLEASDVQIKLNDRSALEAHLTGALGVPAKLVRGTLQVVDRLEKIGSERACAQMTEIGLDQQRSEDVVAFVQAPVIEPSERLAAILEQLEITGCRSYVQLDQRIVRGFDYYTSTVFEAWATGGLRRAVFGGGRYDDLTTQVGGKQRVPGVGMAVGDMALLELLRELKRVPEPRRFGPEVMVTVFGDEQQQLSVRVADSLRRHGVDVELAVDPSQRLERQLRHADRVGANFAVIIGPEEVDSGTVLVKDLIRRQQEHLSATDTDALVERISK